MNHRPAYTLYQWLWSSLDWLYPPRCAGCQRPGARWCAACQASVELIPPQVCERCGVPSSQPGVCAACSSRPPAFTSLRAYAFYSGALRTALLRLKYYRDVAMGEVLARPLISLYQSLGWTVDWVCPTPVGAGRMRQRGYNQAALLARPLALAFGLMYNDRILVKTRETRSQVGLSLIERQGNVAGAFQAKATAGARLPRRVLVVDDTTTTGATLEACSQALREAGVAQVYCLALAQAKFRPAVRTVRINELERCDAGG